MGKLRVYWNTETFSNKVNELTDGEYELIGEYSRSHDKTTFKHLKCGYVFEMTPHVFLRGGRCPHCSNVRRRNRLRKTTEQFKQEVHSLTNGEYEVLSEYKNNKINVLFRHNKCGRTFEMRPNSFISGQRCPSCSSKRGARLRTKTTDQFKRELYDAYGNDYELLSEYINSDTPVKVKHMVCGNIYYSRPADLIRGHGCPKCAYKVRAKKIGDAHRDSLSKVKKSIRDILGDQYVVLTKDSEYKGNRQHILIKHLVCGHTYQARYSDIQYHHTRCPYCSHLGGPSKGEIDTKLVLVNNFGLGENTDFKYGYVIPDLKHKNNLHFDFWLPKYRLAIEYDGRQHFMPINFFGGEHQFIMQQFHDSMKDKYCAKHHITLVRIPYTFNNKKKIFKVLKQYIK